MSLRTILRVAALLISSTIMPCRAQMSEKELREFITDNLDKPVVIDLGEDYAAALPILMEWLEKPESYDGVEQRGYACRATRVFGIIRTEDQPQCVALISQQVASEKPARRIAAAKMLTDIGEPAADQLAALIADKDPAVVRWTVSAINQKVVNERMSGKDFGWVYPLKDGLFSAAAGPSSGRCCPVFTLLELDRERAMPLVTAPQVIADAKEEIYNVLYALNEHRVPVKDTALLKALYKSAVSGKDADEDNAETLLYSLAVAKVPEVQKIIEAKLAARRPSKPEDAEQWAGMTSSAVWAYLLFHDSHRYGQRYRAQCEKDPSLFEKLNESEKTLMLVSSLESDIADDFGMPTESLAQFLVNTPPSRYEATVAALKKIGAPKSAQILASAITSLGKTPLPEEKDARESALDELGEKTQAILAKAPALIVSAEPLEILGARFAVAKKSDFPDLTRK